MIWATINMRNIVYRQSWNLETGELLRWPGNEHAIVITGYDDQYIYLNDPYTGTEKKYKREVVENRYNALGKKAVAVSKPFKEMSVKIISNGTTNYETLNEKAIQKENKILLPARCLSSIDSRITLSYRDSMIYLTIKGQQLELNKKYNEVKILLEDNKSVTLYYEIKDGITQIDLKALKEILPMDYDLQEDEIIIKIHKIMDMVINSKQVEVEKGKEILMKDNKIWLPITYIHELTESFSYEYKDKQIYMYLGEQTYIMKNNEENIDLILEDGTTVKLYYEIENGVTRIEFNGFAEYMKLDYTSEDTMLFIHREMDHDEMNEK